MCVFVVFSERVCVRVRTRVRDMTFGVLVMHARIHLRMYGREHRYGALKTTTSSTWTAASTPCVMSKSSTSSSCLPTWPRSLDLNHAFGTHTHTHTHTLSLSQIAALETHETRSAGSNMCVHKAFTLCNTAHADPQAHVCTHTRGARLGPSLLYDHISPVSL